MLRVFHRSRGQAEVQGPGVTACLGAHLVPQFGLDSGRFIERVCCLVFRVTGLLKKKGWLLGR